MEIRDNSNVNNDSLTPTPERIIRSPLRPSKPADIFNRLEMIEDDLSAVIGFHSGSKKSGIKLALWSWFAAGLDALVLISTSCFFIMVFSFLMKTSPNSVIGLFFKNKNLINVIGVLFLAILWTYLVFMRIFMGASVGELSCGLRLGQPLERLQFSYFLKVMFRTTLILGTGVVVIPVISLLLSRDIAGDICGLKIYSLQ